MKSKKLSMSLLRNSGGAILAFEIGITNQYVLPIKTDYIRIVACLKGSVIRCTASLKGFIGGDNCITFPNRNIMDCCYKQAIR